MKLAQLLCLTKPSWASKNRMKECGNMFFANMNANKNIVFQNEFIVNCLTEAQKVKIYL